MKYVYPAIFTQTNEGYQVNIPDLPGYIASGLDLADAIDMARDAAEMWLWDAENKNETIPQASPESKIKKLLQSKDQFVNYVAADTDKYRRENDTRAVKKTLSIPLWLNVKAEKANAPYSQILQQGLKEYLGISDKK